MPEERWPLDRLFIVSIATLFFVALSLFAVRILGLKRPIPTDSVQVFPEKFSLVAHRGGAGEAPENTLHAFRSAAKIDTSIAFELDIHLSKDGHPVVIHDDTVDRTTDGSGRVSDMTLEELQKLNASAKFAGNLADALNDPTSIRIPHLQEVLSEFPDRKLILEIKDSRPGIEDIVIELLRAARAEERVIVSSFQEGVIQRFRQKAPELKYGATQAETLRALILLSMWVEPAGSFPASLYAIPEKHRGVQVFSQRLLDEVHRRKKKLFIWTVNEPADMQRLMSAGVDGIVTDYPARLYKLLKSQ